MEIKKKWIITKTEILCVILAEEFRKNILLQIILKNIKENLHKKIKNIHQIITIQFIVESKEKIKLITM